MCEDNEWDEHVQYEYVVDVAWVASIIFQVSLILDLFWYHLKAHRHLFLIPDC